MEHVRVFSYFLPPGSFSDLPHWTTLLEIISSALSSCPFLFPWQGCQDWLFSLFPWASDSFLQRHLDLQKVFLTGKSLSYSGLCSVGARDFSNHIPALCYHAWLYTFSFVSQTLIHVCYTTAGIHSERSAWSSLTILQPLILIWGGGDPQNIYTYFSPNPPLTCHLSAFTSSLLASKVSEQQ